MTLEEAAFWALQHFYHEDKANAVMHCAPVRFSPITFRLAEALLALYPRELIVLEVYSHRGSYQEDTGRD